MLLDDLQTYIAAQATALSKLSGTGGNLVKGEMPDTSPAPDTLVALFDTGGLPSLASWSTGTLDDKQFTRHRVQVLSRSTSYSVAYTNAWTVFNLLDGLDRALPTTSGTRCAIDAVSPPFDAGKDRNERHMVSANYDVWRTA